MPVLAFFRRNTALGMGLLLPILLTAGAPLRAEAPVSKEYQVKAVFLFNFAQFVQWPPKSFTSAGDPFYIGILGEDPFDAFLDETVKGEKVDGHPLVIRRYGNVEEATGCQILFISRSEAGRMADILSSLKGRNILTVADSGNFIENGGVVYFVTEGKKIHFKISLEAAKQAKLTISSQVLRLAQIAGPGKE